MSQKEEAYVIARSTAMGAIIELVTASEAIGRSEDDIISDINDCIFEAGKSWEIKEE